MQRPPGFENQIHGVLDHRQRLEAQKVELDQPGLFHPLHVELGGGHIRSRIAVQRHQLIGGPVRDHHTGGMGPRRAQKPLHLHAVFQQPVDHLFVLGFFGQTWFIAQRLFDTDGFDALHRDHLGQAIHLPVRHLQHAPHVAHCRLGQERAKGNDLPHPVVAIFILHIADHFFAAIHAKIDVEIRHRHPFRVQEPLKQQRIAQRIKVGDRQSIGHQGPGPGPPPRTHRDRVVLGPLDEIRNNQKIAGKAHALDDAQLKFQPLPVLFHRHRVRDHRQSFFQPLLRDTAQLGDLVIGEFWQDRIPPIGHKGTALRDLDRVFQSFRQIGKQHRHFLRRLEVMLRRQAAARFLLIHICPLRDADHRVMGLIHLRLGEIDVVGGNQGQVHLIGHFHQAAL